MFDLCGYARKRASYSTLSATTPVYRSVHSDTFRRCNIAKSLHIQVYNGFAIFHA